MQYMNTLNIFLKSNFRNISFPVALAIVCFDDGSKGVLRECRFLQPSIPLPHLYTANRLRPLLFFFGNRKFFVALVLFLQRQTPSINQFPQIQRVIDFCFDRLLVLFIPHQLILFYDPLYAMVFVVFLLHPNPKLIII